MAGHDNLVASEALGSHLNERLFDIVINKNGLRCVKNEFGETHPDALAHLLGCLELYFLSEWDVCGVLAVHTVDPNDGDVVGAFVYRRNDDCFSCSLNCQNCSTSK